MNSAPHRAVMLDPAFTHVGFSSAGLYWTGNFGAAARVVPRPIPRPEPRRAPPRVETAAPVRPAPQLAPRPAPQPQYNLRAPSSGFG